MVNISHVLIALILFAILLAAALTMLSGVVPGVNETLRGIECAAGLRC